MSTHHGLILKASWQRSGFIFSLDRLSCSSVCSANFPRDHQGLTWWIFCSLQDHFAAVPAPRQPYGFHIAALMLMAVCCWICVCWIAGYWSRLTRGQDPSVSSPPGVVGGSPGNAMLEGKSTKFQRCEIHRLFKTTLWINKQMNDKMSDWSFHHFVHNMARCTGAWNDPTQEK